MSASRSRPGRLRPPADPGASAWPVSAGGMNAEPHTPHHASFHSQFPVPLLVPAPRGAACAASTGRGSRHSAAWWRHCGERATACDPGCFCRGRGASAPPPPQVLSADISLMPSWEAALAEAALPGALILTACGTRRPTLQKAGSQGSQSPRRGRRGLLAAAFSFLSASLSSLHFSSSLFLKVQHNPALLPHPPLRPCWSLAWPQAALAVPADY